MLCIVGTSCNPFPQYIQMFQLALKMGNNLVNCFNLSENYIGYVTYISFYKLYGKIIDRFRHSMINYVNITLPAFNLSIECLLNFGGES